MSKCKVCGVTTGSEELDRCGFCGGQGCKTFLAGIIDFSYCHHQEPYLQLAKNVRLRKRLRVCGNQ